MRTYLRYRTICNECGDKLPTGTAAHREARKYRCLACGPWPLTHRGWNTTLLPAGAAEGAHDSQRPMGTKRQTGLGRNRLPSAARRARQRRLNTAD